jgi:hypothetical protein
VIEGISNFSSTDSDFGMAGICTGVWAAEGTVKELSPESDGSETEGTANEIA